MDRPQMCQRVRVKARAVKQRVPTSKVRFETKWVREELPEVIEGAYTGFRIKFEGVTSKAYDYEVGYTEKEHKRTASKEVWLIAFDEQKNHILAFPEDVEVVTRLV